MARSWNPGPPPTGRRLNLLLVVLVSLGVRPAADKEAMLARRVRAVVGCMVKLMLKT